MTDDAPRRALCRRCFGELTAPEFDHSPLWHTLSQSCLEVIGKKVRRLEELENERQHKELAREQAR